MVSKLIFYIDLLSSAISHNTCKAFNQWFSIASYQTGACDAVFAILSVPPHYIGGAGPYIAFFGWASPKGGRCGSGVCGCFSETEGEGAGGGQVDMFIGQQGGVSDVLWLSDCRSRRFRRTVSSIGTLAQLSFPLTSLLAVWPSLLYDHHCYWIHL